MMTGLHMNRDSAQTFPCPGYNGQRAVKCKGEYSTVSRKAKRCEWCSALARAIQGRTCAARLLAGMGKA